ncbi:MAG: type III-A CRISPR-associated RAMP protein Csm4 [Candidatus Omnitrophica bacterium]|nr:type III-A CRISPR-associated RAMP protein Csm4 [Candidatus Omnitrophota bacterium]
MKLYKLKFKSSIHLGERENFLETTEIIAHSDTLFSTFCNAYLLLYGKDKLEILLKRFIDQNPPFLISSAFPWWNGNFYFPIPLNQMPKEKKLKDIRFIEKDGFEKLLWGEKIEKLVKNGFKTIPELDAEKEENKKPYRIINTPRVSLNRLTNHPGEEFFHFGEVFYKDNSGLFFLVDFKDKEIEKEFNATLRIMADEGLGGDRTVGKGFFEIKEIKDINFNFPSEHNGFLTLSLYSPKEDEIRDIRNGYYEIIERKGYISSPYGKNLRRKSIRVFKEGSVFPHLIKIGRLVDVTPEVFTEHKIYRYGLAFLLPCKLEVKDEN